MSFFPIISSGFLAIVNDAIITKSDVKRDARIVDKKLTGKDNGSANDDKNRIDDGCSIRRNSENNRLAVRDCNKKLVISGILVILDNRSTIIDNRFANNTSYLVNTRTSIQINADGIYSIDHRFNPWFCNRQNAYVQYFCYH